MNGRYKAYGEYKESGVAWLGEVPEGWNIFSIRRSLTGCTNGIWGSEPNGKGDIIVLRVADFERNSFLISDEKLTKRQISQRERFGRLLKCGDLLLEKSGGGDKTLVGCVVLFDKKYSAVTSNFVAKMSPLKGYSSNFLTFCFSQLYAGKVNYPSIKQTTGIQNLDSDAYLMEKFSFPSYEEQTQIATFLDHETAKIDTLIDKQQQLIELLKEKRQAVISHAVTKGLDPDVPMKDSGVEWLGEVPEHWTIKKSKYFFDFVTSGSRGWADYYSDDGPIFFRIANLTRESIDPKLISIQRVTVPHGSEGVRSKIQKNDILISITADLGSVCVADNSIYDGYVSQHISLCRPNELVKSSRWLAYCIISDSTKEQLLGVGYGGTKIQLSLEDIKEFILCFPPLDEQEFIASYLDKELLNFEKLDDIAQQQIELLQERRTALISAAVTGKIDVRDWQVPVTQTESDEVMA